MMSAQTPKLEILALDWQVWPLRRQGWNPRAFAILLLASLIWLVLLVSLPTIAGITLGFALIISLLPYYLPTYYRIDSEGIIVCRSFGLGKRKRKWAEFLRCEAQANGYLLSPFANTSQVNRLEPFRSVWLPKPSDEAANAILHTQLSIHFNF